MSGYNSIDIAYGRAPMAPLAERLKHAANWNREAAAKADRTAQMHDADRRYGKARKARADVVRHRLNIAECDTALAELLAGEMRRAA